MIVGWQLDNQNFYTSRFNEKGSVQVPPSTEPENYVGIKDVLLNYEGPTTERTWENQRVAEILSSHLESKRFTTMMQKILPHQGTNTRVLLYKCLLLMERDGLVPELRTNDPNAVVEEIIANGWLDQPPPAAFAERIENKDLSLEKIIKRGKSRERYLWGLAGAMASSGRWRDFQSREQYYKLLMTFWGLRAPPRIPALSGKGIMDEGSVQPSFSGYPHHKDFVAAYRSSRPSPSQEEPQKKQRWLKSRGQNYAQFCL